MNETLKRFIFENRILKLSLAKQFLLLILFLTIGVLLTNYLINKEIRKVSIHGEIYQQIIAQNNLIQDTLPPPGYLIEAWQVALEMSLPYSNIKELTIKEKKLGQEFEATFIHWNKAIKPNTTEFKELNEVYQTGKVFLNNIEKILIPSYQAGDKEKIKIAYFQTKSAYLLHRNAVDTLIETSKKNAANIEVASNLAVKNNVILTNAILILFTIFSAIMSWGLVFNIKRQLGLEPSELVNIAKEISDGNLQQKISIDLNNKSSVAYSIKNLKNILDGMVQSITYVSEQQNAGDVDCIVDPIYFKGGYADIANRINVMMKIHILNTEKAISVVRSFGEGNFEAPLEQFPGKLAYINNTIEQVRSNLKNLISDTDLLSQAALEGNLSIRAEDSKHKGDFRKIVEGINKTLDAVISPLNIAAECIDNIAKGQIPNKIEDHFNGDFNTLINNLNLCIDAINAMIEDESMLADAAKSGRLSARADINRHQGDFRKIVEGVNHTLDAVLEPFIMTTQYIDLIAHGNVPAKIEGVYHGDFNSLKNDLNTCIDAINNLVSDANMLAEAANDGRITIRANVTTHEGDFRKIVEGINQTLDLIVEPISTVKVAVETIKTAAGEISSGNHHLSLRTEEQSKNLEKTATSMNELSTKVKQNSESAKQANQLVDEASKIAFLGGQAVGDVVSTMSEINESALKIVDIITVIDSISFQTNILALNAAVEAARAGEQGRGFAVVAGEVRNLAQRSASAAKEIKALIKESVTKTSEGTIQVEKAGKTMHEIVNSVERVTNIMGEILTASVEQSADIDQVNKAISSMDEVTQKNTVLVKEATSAAESLIDLANNLVRSVSNFKVDQDDNIAYYSKKSQLQKKSLVESPLNNAEYSSKNGTYDESNIDFF